jgi:hypothetical protein
MCYILSTSSSVCVASGVHVGLEATTQRIFFPREMCHIFASFYMLPRFLCPLLGGFSPHGFCQWFSISD